MGIGRIIGDAESGSNRGGHYELALYVPLALAVGLQWHVYECGSIPCVCISAGTYNGAVAVNSP